MKSKISDSEALNRLMKMCSKTEKSPDDLIKKLRLWNYSGNVDLIIDKLKEEGFINERRFAEAFIHDKIKFLKWGKIKIRYHLIMKGIGEDTACNLLDKFPLSEYIKLITKEIEKKNESLGKMNPLQRKQKLILFGKQRGYEHDLILQVIDKL